MSTAVSAPATGRVKAPADSTGPFTAHTHHFDIPQYRQLVDSGVFGITRVELWEGKVVDRMTHGPLACSTIMMLTSLIGAIIRDRYAIRVQLPIETADSSPEPDLAIVRGSALDYRRRQPRPEETLLVMEVSDSTLADDRKIKHRIYARAGIETYWIVNCADRQVEVLSSPGERDGSSVYLVERIFRATEMIPLNVDGAQLGVIPVAELFD